MSKAAIDKEHKRKENINMSTEEEIINIQTKLSYLEDFVNQLQEVTVEHSKTIEILTNENRLLKNKIQEMSDQLEGEIPNRKPPHY